MQNSAQDEMVATVCYWVEIKWWISIHASADSFNQIRDLSVYVETLKKKRPCKKSCQQFFAARQEIGIKLLTFWHS